MKDITNIAVTGEDGVVTYADGSKEEFECSGTVAAVIASLATTLEKERTMRIATGDRLRRMYTRDSDMVSRGLNGAPSLSTAPTAMTAEFMRLVRAVAPKYDSALPDADPRLVALDVLRYAPAEAFSAVHPTDVRNSAGSGYRRAGAGRRLHEGQQRRTESFQHWRRHPQH